MEKTDVHNLIASYFDCGWEPYENDPKVKELVTEMKKLSDMYLKAKNSKSGDNMVATLAMEAELKRLKEELIEAVEAASENSEAVGESTVVEAVDLSEATEDSAAENAESEEVIQPKVRQVKESSSKKDKLPLLALGLGGLALVASATTFFLSSGNVTKIEFEEYKSGAHGTVMKDVTEATQSVRDELETFRKDAEAIRIDVAALRAEMGAAKQELTDKLAAQSDELGLRIAALQASLKKPQPAKKLSAPLAKPKAGTKAPVKAAPKRR